MTIWKYTPNADQYYNLRMIDYERDGWFLHEALRADPLPEPFPEIPVRYETELNELSPLQRRLARQGEMTKGDFPSFYAVGVVFSERALQVLSPLIQNSVQVIPLQSVEEHLYLIHVTEVVDCLDIERSEVDYILGGEHISHIKHYEFKNLELLEEIGIFEIQDLRASTFVTDEFKKIVEEHDLKGLLWKPLP
jgi:hypothetical protein